MECINRMQKPGKGADLSAVPDVLTYAGKKNDSPQGQDEAKHELLKDLQDCTNMVQLKKTLENKELWRVSYKNDPEDDKYPRRGWCGYLAYSEIKMGEDKPPDPSTDVGAQTMIAALKELVRFAPGSSRQNWASIPREHMRYPKEILLTIIEKLSQMKSFLSNRNLPLLNWIPAKILDGTCARLNYSRWALGLENEDYNYLMEGPTDTGTITKHGRAPDYTVEWENDDL